MMIPLIIFVDNTPIFYDASPTQLCYLRWILICFKAVSRLRINENETEIVPIGEGLKFLWILKQSSWLSCFLLSYEIFGFASGNLLQGKAHLGHYQLIILRGWKRDWLAGRNCPYQKGWNLLPFFLYISYTCTFSFFSFHFFLKKKLHMHLGLKLITISLIKSSLSLYFQLLLSLLLLPTATGVARGMENTKGLSLVVALLRSNRKRAL